MNFMLNKLVTEYKVPPSMCDTEGRLGVTNASGRDRGAFYMAGVRRRSKSHDTVQIAVIKRLTDTKRPGDRPPVFVFTVLCVMRFMSAVSDFPVRSGAEALWHIWTLFPGSGRTFRRLSLQAPALPADPARHSAPVPVPGWAPFRKA